MAWTCGCHLGHLSQDEHVKFWERYAKRRREKNHPELRAPKKLSKAQRRKNRKRGLTANGLPKNLVSPGRKPQFQRPDYHAYINSKRWAKRRDEFYERHGKQCEVCGSTIGVQLHHKTYVRLGRERDADLQPLCSGCHQNEHEADGVVDPMTRRFLSLHL